MAVAAALVLCAPAQAAKRHDVLPLHPGSAGPRVAALQWLLGGHRPNVFTKVKGTYKGSPNGYFGPRTAKDLYDYKYALGYPMKWNSKTKPVAGAYFFKLVTGKTVWPASFVANRAKRLRAVEAGASPLALRIRAFELSQLGTAESPPGSNRGPRISYRWNGVGPYQGSTGAYGAAWCVSFQQYSFAVAGYGYFADRTAGVFYAVGWARERGYLHAKPKVGAIVAFMDGQGHMGFVAKVTAGGFVSYEGNASNRVLERWHSLTDRRPVFIYLPRVA